MVVGILKSLFKAQLCKSFHCSMASLMSTRFHSNVEKVDRIKDSLQNILANQNIILASGSPRRQEILKLMGLDFIVMPSTFEENLKIGDFENPEGFVIETARQKALDVVTQLKTKNVEADLVISADTIVWLEGRMFGKPKDAKDAKVMLNRLSKKTHQVISGVILIFPQKKPSGNNGSPFIHSFHDTTEVTMIDMNPEVIDAYVKSGEPLDKAGSYAIQGNGCDLVEKICGDFFNVVGFPLFKCYEEIETLHEKGLFEKSNS